MIQKDLVHYKGPKSDKLLGGTVGRREATGRGCKIVCDRTLSRFRMKRENTRVIIQGFGNVGSMAARILHESGYLVVGVSDITGGIYDPRGINVTQLIAHAEEAETVVGFPDADAISGAELLEQPCEILLPAATEARSLFTMPTKSKQGSFVKELMILPPLRPTRSYMTSGPSSSLIFWPAQEV